MWLNTHMAASYKAVQADLQKISTPKKAAVSAWFFKTGKGQYGYGDKFRGVTVPEQRKIAKQFKDSPLTEILKLLQSPWHEDRLTALFILVGQYQEGDVTQQQTIVKYYLQYKKYVNNWDLVDSSADKILGEYLYTTKQSFKRLKVLAMSRSVWDRRIGMIATYAFIKHGDPKPTLFVARFLQRDQHDLIHKAVGWMLREVGERCSREAEETFLKEFAAAMPRTMLRYAIEKFSPAEKQRWLKATA